jgi:hypothetical protein
MILRHAVLVLVTVGTWTLSGGTASAADEELIDCREVDCFQRAACNRRILAAMSGPRFRFAEGDNSLDAARQIAIHHARQERLQSFVAPECRPTRSTTTESSPSGISTAYDEVRRFFERLSQPSNRSISQAWPLPAFARKIDVDRDGLKRLKGRWDGWIHFYHVRSSVPLWVQVTEVPYNTDQNNREVGLGYVRACTDQGLVMGRVEENGILQLPRREALAFGSRILLWRSPPDYDDLDGVVLLEIEPGQWLESGLVWLSRALSSASSAEFAPPTDYLCQSKEILDRRNEGWRPR